MQEKAKSDSDDASLLMAYCRPGLRTTLMTAEQARLLGFDPGGAHVVIADTAAVRAALEKIDAIGYGPPPPSPTAA